MPRVRAPQQTHQTPESRQQRAAAALTQENVMCFEGGSGLNGTERQEQWVASAAATASTSPGFRRAAVCSALCQCVWLPCTPAVGFQPKGPLNKMLTDLMTIIHPQEAGRINNQYFSTGRQIINVRWWGTSRSHAKKWAACEKRETIKFTSPHSICLTFMSSVLLCRRLLSLKPELLLSP